MSRRARALCRRGSSLAPPPRKLAAAAVFARAARGARSRHHRGSWPQPPCSRAPPRERAEPPCACAVVGARTRRRRGSWRDPMRVRRRVGPDRRGSSHTSSPRGTRRHHGSWSERPYACAIAPARAAEGARLAGGASSMAAGRVPMRRMGTLAGSPGRISKYATVPRCAAVQGESGRVVCVEDPGSQDTLIGSFFI